MLIKLLLAAVLVTSVGQVLFCWIIWRYCWYSSTARVLITICALVSSFGGIWFIIRSLTGLDGTLGLATLYAVPQAIALCLILTSRMYEVFSENKSQISEVSNRLEHMEEADEDRFSEKEEEQGDVRARLVLAAKERDERLDRLERKLDEILGRIGEGR